MSVLSKLSSAEFNTQREQWENLLKAELKLPDVGSKTLKKSVDGGVWPTLSLSCEQSVQLSVKETWKRSAQTYVTMTNTVEADIRQDISHGVRTFFFFKEYLSQESWKRISIALSDSGKVKELEVYLLGNKSFATGAVPFNTIDEAELFSGRKSHDEGGTIVQELALMTCELIERLESAGEVVSLGVFTDSQFFRNIAKLRAARLLALKVLQESKSKKEVSLLALSSYREWTLYERYSNMLRNDAAVASALIGGADHVQSSGYNVLFEFGGSFPGEHHERSLRMARNSSHILALESMLGVVQDAAFGSFHLEGLTHHFAQEAWKEMQTLIGLDPTERERRVQEEAGKVRETRLKELRTRKHVLAGINDFPDSKERLFIQTLPSFGFFRLAEGFESLRVKMENAKNRPSVYVGVFGDYAALNARLNFVKNYFQLLGLEVQEVLTADELAAKEGIAVLCAQDDDYPKFSELKLKAQDKFIAGKIEIPGHINLYAGQDVLSVLEGIVKRWSAQ